MIIELIKEYNSTVSLLKRVNNPKVKLFAIIDFFKTCEKEDHSPPHYTFIEKFVPILIKIFRSYNINFIDPDYLEYSKRILIISKTYYETDIMSEQINLVLDYINMQLLKIYFYLGEVEEGVGILGKMVEKRSSSDNDDFKNVKLEFNKNNKYAIVSEETFKKSRAFEILDEIKLELDKLHGYSNSEINTVLVEENTGEYDFGNIQSLNVEIKKVKKEKIEFCNLKDTEEDFSDLNKKIRLSLIRLTGKADLKNLSIKFYYSEIKNIYKGKSFLMAATLIAFCRYTQYKNNILKFKISSAAAFTGNINDNSDLLKLPDDIIKIKLSAVFFSWARYFVIPKENLVDAENELKNLKSKYPKRNLQLIGIENIKDIFNYPEVMKPEKDNILKYSGSLLKRNKVLSAAVFIVLIFLMSLIVVTKLLPKQIKHLPKSDAEMYLAYSPNSDTIWYFKNNAYKGGDTINFGDVAIGDIWYPLLEFINNSWKQEKIFAELGGPDKNEFEVLWRTEGGQPLAPSLNPDIKQRLYIKFRPLDVNKLCEKSATLNFYTESNPEYKKTIYLKGTSTRYKSGYALSFEKTGDELFIDFKQNVLGENYIMEFWFKPEDMEIKKEMMIFTNDNGSSCKSTLILNPDSTLNLNFNYRKAIEHSDNIKSKAKVKLGQWNFVEIVLKKNKGQLILNDDVTKFNIKDNLSFVNDRIIFADKEPEKRNFETHNELTHKFMIDELCFWNNADRAGYISKNKFKKKTGNEEGLVAYYDFDEANFETVFDLTKNDFWGVLYGGITRKMDSPLPKEEKDFIASSENHFLKMDNKGYFFSSRNLFDKASSFTLQVDAKHDAPSDIRYKSVFSISKPEQLFQQIFYNEYFLFIFSNRISNANYTDSIKFSPGKKWHRYTLCYSYENNLIKFYIDGKETVKLDSLNYKFDISRWLYGICFGGDHFFYAPKYIQNPISIDNAKIYNRPIAPNEIYGDSNDGLLAYWDFENIDNELAYDKVNNLPGFIWYGNVMSGH